MNPYQTPKSEMVETLKAENARLRKVLEKCRDQTSDLWIIDIVDAALKPEGGET